MPTYHIVHMRYRRGKFKLRVRSWDEAFSIFIKNSKCIQNFFRCFIERWFLVSQYLHHDCNKCWTIYSFLWSHFLPVFMNFMVSRILSQWSNNRSYQRLLKSFFLIFKRSPDKSILFLKSMSESGGSDIERLWIWMASSSLDSESIYKFTIISSLYVGSTTFRHWFQK